MGSPLSPAIANIFMSHLEKSILSKSPKKPKFWLRYVNDTFVIWQHGPEALDNFLEFLNNSHPNITFIMETEINSQLPFLDLLINKNPDGTLGHTIYRWVGFL